MRYYFILIPLLIIFILSLGFGYWYLNRPPQYVSPLPDNPGQIKYAASTKRDFYVLGFLPHWNLDKWNVNLKPFDEIVFFTYDVDNQGNIENNQISNAVHTEKFQNIKEELQKQGKTLSFSLRLFQDDDIDLLVNNTASHRNLVNNIETKLIDGDFDGINIDFEYANNPTAILNKNFVSMLKTIKEETGAVISVDFYSNTIYRGDQELLAEIADTVDHIVIMAYDFHRPGSTNTGPVAPLRTRTNDKNIINTLRVANEKFPREKLIMAFPLYGYEWYTANEEFASQTLDKPTALASYGRMKDFIKENADVKIFWDRVGESPWLVYKDGNFTKQIYYEDLRSLKIKLSLIQQTEISGIGFWSLGYEGDNNDIWEEVIKRMKDEK